MAGRAAGAVVLQRHLDQHEARDAGGLGQQRRRVRDVLERRARGSRGRRPRPRRARGPRRRPRAARRAGWRESARSRSPGRRARSRRTPRWSTARDNAASSAPSRSRSPRPGRGRARPRAQLDRVGGLGPRPDRPPASHLQALLVVLERVARGVERGGVLVRGGSHRGGEPAPLVARLLLLGEVDDARSRGCGSGRTASASASSGSGRPRPLVSLSLRDQHAVRAGVVGADVRELRRALASHLERDLALRLGADLAPEQAGGAGRLVDHERRGHHRQHRLGLAVVVSAAPSASRSSAWCRCRGCGSARRPTGRRTGRARAWSSTRCRPPAAGSASAAPSEMPLAASGGEVS